MSSDYRGIGPLGEDDVLRQMIRESIARHSDSGLVRAAAPSVGGAALHSGPAVLTFPLLRSGDDDGACVIEPSVRCNHCGYCLSYGQ